MPNTERVTVTLPVGIVDEIDRLEPNRSRFVLEAVRHELWRRRSEDLRRSLRAPHPESSRFAEEGFGEWAERLPDDTASDLVDLTAGTEVEWIPEKGWSRARDIKRGRRR